jgi:hypothetical protein
VAGEPESDYHFGSSNTAFIQCSRIHLVAQHSECGSHGVKIQCLRFSREWLISHRVDYLRSVK